MWPENAQGWTGLISAVAFAIALLSILLATVLLGRNIITNGVDLLSIRFLAAASITASQAAVIRFAVKYPG